MLKIFFGEMENAIYTPSIYFNNQYEDEWLEEDLAKAMIEDVDQSKVVSSHLIESPVLGPIPPERLSGGVKTLLLMAFGPFRCGGGAARFNRCHPGGGSSWRYRKTFSGYGGPL